MKQREGQPISRGSLTAGVLLALSAPSPEQHFYMALHAALQLSAAGEAL